MKESELLGKLMPGHPDIFPIIENIREKYQIPEVRPEDDIDAILLTRDDIDWDAVRQDIETQVRESPLFSDPVLAQLQKLKDIQNAPLDIPGLENASEEIKAVVKNLIVAMIQAFMPAGLINTVDSLTYKATADMIFEYLLTGKTRDVPQDWFSKVETIVDPAGNKFVLAIANELADPKEIAEQFKSEFTKAFGKDRPKITETHLETAEYLAEKLAGKSPKYLVEMYQERHPDEFPSDRSSKKYRETVEKHKRMMEKRIQRLKDVIDKRVADEK